MLNPLLEVNARPDVTSERFVRQHLDDWWWRLNNLYYIEDEQGQLLLFRPRMQQRQFLRALWYYNIILKSRQHGFTTLIDIFGNDLSLFTDHFKAGIIAQDLGSAGEIFRTKIEVPWLHLPHWLQQRVYPETQRANHWIYNNGSSIRVATSMRSGTLQFLHISEYGKICAKYPEKAKEVRSGSLNTLHEGAYCFIESTAEGVGGDFYDKSVKSKQRRDEGRELSRMDYKFHFFPWFEDPKCRMPVTAEYQPDAEALAYYADVEATMQVTLDDEQRAWHHKKHEEQGDEMYQEYPSTPMEAFLFSGRPAFNPKHLNSAEQQCRPPEFFAEVQLSNGLFDERADGRLLVWGEPIEGEIYTIGADVAEGLEHGDHSSVDVLDDRGRQVAHWNGHLEPGEFGILLNWLGRHYNNAYMGVERNNHGHAVLQRLKDLDYPNLHQEQKIDEAAEKETLRVGWLTTSSSKPFIIDGLRDALRDGESGIQCAATVDECHTYVIDEKGRFGAQEKCFDDRVMSYAIAVEMHRRRPRYTAKAPERKRAKRDWRG